MVRIDEATIRKIEHAINARAKVFYEHQNDYGMDKITEEIRNWTNGAAQILCWLGYEIEWNDKVASIVPFGKDGAE